MENTVLNKSTTIRKPFLSSPSTFYILKTSPLFLAGVDGFFLCFIIYLPLSLSLFDDDDFHGIEADVTEVREGEE